MVVRRVVVVEKAEAGVVVKVEAAGDETIGCRVHHSNSILIAIETVRAAGRRLQCSPS